MGDRNTEPDTQHIDWVESFSLLLGLRVIRMGPWATIKEFSMKTTCIRFLPVISWRPTAGDGREQVLVLWRDWGDGIDQDDAVLRQWLAQVRLIGRALTASISMGQPELIFLWGRCTRLKRYCLSWFEFTSPFTGSLSTADLGTPAWGDVRLGISLGGVIQSPLG